MNAPTQNAPIDRNPLAPEDSYRRDGPMWEPVFPDEPFMTTDGYNLTKLLGRRTVRKSYPEEVRAAHPDHFMPIGDVGLDYTFLGNGTFFGIVDDVTAPFGGRPVLGRAHVHEGPVISCTVKLPKSLCDMLSLGGIDPAQRIAYVCGRTSHDGSYVASLALIVARKSAGALVPGTLLSARRKHTKGIVFLPERLKEYAERVPQEIERYVSTLRAFAEMSFNRVELEQVVKAITDQERAGNKIVDLVISANGDNVPAPHEAQEPGTYSGLQVYEACAAYDRHYRTVRKDSKDADMVRLNRLVDGQAFGTKAWEVLAARMDPEVNA
jgi:hypothetical protein